jgi:hypothetical protein
MGIVRQIKGQREGNVDGLSMRAHPIIGLAGVLLRTSALAESDEE